MKPRVNCAPNPDFRAFDIRHRPGGPADDQGGAEGACILNLQRETVFRVVQAKLTSFICTLHLHTLHDSTTQAGDVLVLTKPLGSGVLLAAASQRKAKGRCEHRAMFIILSHARAGNNPMWG